LISGPGEKHIRLVLHHDAGKLTAEGTFRGRPLELSGTAAGEKFVLQELGPDGSARNTFEGEFRPAGYRSGIASLMGYWKAAGQQDSIEWLYLREVLEPPDLKVTNKQLYEQRPLLEIRINYPELSGKGSFKPFNAWAKAYAMAELSELREDAEQQHRQMLKDGMTEKAIAEGEKNGHVGVNSRLGGYEIIHGDSRFISVRMSRSTDVVNTAHPLHEEACVTVERVSGRLLRRPQDYFGKNDVRAILRKVVKRDFDIDLEEDDLQLDDGWRSLCLTRRGVWVYFNFAHVAHAADGMVIPYADIEASMLPEVRPAGGP
jgi:hypothetical protein